MCAPKEADETQCVQTFVILFWVVLLNQFLSETAVISVVSEATGASRWHIIPI